MAAASNIAAHARIFASAWAKEIFHTLHSIALFHVAPKSFKFFLLCHKIWETALWTDGQLILDYNPYNSY